MVTLPQSDRSNLTRFLQDLVRIPSLSCQEGELAQRLAAEMEEVGFDEVRIDRIGNVIGRIGSGEGPRLLYNGHMDTVGIGDSAAWTHDPFGAEIDGDRLYGCGSSDMKGSLAAMVYGLKQVIDRATPLSGTIYLVGAVLEEPAEGLGMRVLIEEEGLRPDMVILGEPSSLQVCRGHRGRIQMEVNVQGKSAHASAPERGENAIYSAVRLIFSLELLASMLAEDPFLGQGTLAITKIENTGGSTNAVPDSCRFIIDRRLILGETPTKALAEVQNLIEREKIRAGVSTTTHTITSYTGLTRDIKVDFPAWVTEENHRLVQACVRAVQKASGHRPPISRWRFSTDGVYTMGVAGIPTAGFGPGNEAQAHTADEYVSLSACYTAAEAYAQLALELVGKNSRS